MMMNAGFGAVSLHIGEFEHHLAERTRNHDPMKGTAQ